MLAPRVPVDFEATFEAHFKSTTTPPIEVGVLLESRERLSAHVAGCAVARFSAIR
ncbi:hypothetical protein [Thauera sp. SDU_THAU2]|uniref:hypothetical protein n=1 Tax=Thauera sp. SDU_THAU2 TaxID=3136633 RepID=UPI00311EAFFF